ncbi:SIR2 family NAD-dependent protein deacylase [Streptomyces iconiensis]|uniref:protein acetyllysine N-acetyltransferase n=1 Tax=Streptomyces iconiensis TaxID=1384038 RepID=A0ABT6ZUH4_9ACTN|nr:Sir2 family NAD-dependent protein deacetylase [Streptomyces iconiensis]MDJ1132720.1 Sir2 family NAD-dependent protein deacetylase [Streptomyces iconiensis]
MGAGEREAPLVALLSGAGISTDSGIPDYRGPQGVWRRDPEAEKLVTYEYYMTDPEIRRRSWRMRGESPLWEARPNAAHEAVARLHDTGTPTRVITQNVDGLHQAAGLPDHKVMELHGNARTVLCTGCGDRTTMRRALERVAAGEPDPPCERCGAVLKSATVMFGQALDQGVLAEAVAVTKACDEFLAVGTSLQVQPAASLAGLAVEHGARLTIVNAEPTPYDALAADLVREPISEALPRLLEHLGKHNRQDPQNRAPQEPPQDRPGRPGRPGKG